MQDAEEFCIDDEGSEEEKKARPVVKNAMDLQRLKLEKLMKNPEKPIIIPEPSREKDFMQTVPTFVRNVMGSSAGAGSGEFHVYRHLRRKEYARQKYIQAKSIREQLDDEYRQKLEQNRLDAEAKTAKRRAKRLKKKQKMKQKGKKRRKESEGSQHEEDNLSESSAESDTGGEQIIAIEDSSQDTNGQQSQSKGEQQNDSISSALEKDNSADVLQGPSIREEAGKEDLSCSTDEVAHSADGDMKGEDRTGTECLESVQTTEVTDDGEKAPLSKEDSSK